jgi:hypothetical protein
MPKKKKDAHQQHLEMDHYYLMNAPSIKETYPNVTKIVVNCTYTDFDQSVEEIKRRREFTQDNKAWFTLRCPYPECKMGGFDLGPYITQALNQHRSKGEGKQFCSGRLDGWECRCILTYTFEVVYS